MTILYVRKAFGRLIRSAGFAVETFPSGAEFLKSLTDHQPDCVLLDLHMPIQDGLEVHAQLTREHFADNGCRDHRSRHTGIAIASRSERSERVSVQARRR